MSGFVFLNDDFVPEKDARIHFRDLAIQRGYAVFDFFKVRDGKPVLLTDHLNRFYFSASEMHLEVPYHRSRLEKIIWDLLLKNDTGSTGVRMTLTGGYSEDGYQLSKPNFIIALHEYSPPTLQQLEKGISLVTYSHQRQLPAVKTTDYLMGIWLQKYIREHNADDVLYHQNGVITECPRSNFFIVTHDNVIITPAQHILKGITRNRLITCAGQNHIVVERPVTIDDVSQAKEAFITSTTKTILPVRKIDDISFRQPADKTTEMRNFLMNMPESVT